MRTASRIRTLRFIWSLSSVGDSLRRSKALTTLSGAPDVEGHLEFCRQAEASGIESLLMAFGFTRPDPLAYSAALGQHTDKIKFLVAVRSGIVSPTYFVQQVNTLSQLTGGRVCINIVAGRAPDELKYYGDFLTHDERYERTDEFWDICHALWRGEGPVDYAGRHYRVEGARINTPFGGDGMGRPEIYIGGSSEQAIALAIRHADCLLTLPDAPERMAERIRPVLDSGTEVGLLVSLISKPTRAEAIDAAYELVATAGEQAKELHGTLRGRSDSVGYRRTYDLAAQEDSWASPYLWTGAVPYLGPPGISLVGSPEDIVEALEQYRDIGVSQFLFMGHPDLEQMTFFGREVLPLVRERERATVR
ncbi:MAG TPA: LLM class flavin-dependent oxidoreductase [Actinophytocola sp.]|uniref:LLM class flavin-dependent oxidoreductase n=1 Tax=Actinophytocola sp. TaxID=1872138 RepID=UPI002DDCEEB7|nr:LLM class flavin-dependent oxidoreductase [Actinophytocola sp.]HEV2783752.1 LLM class flavin-dependent oxidoreductase [Actinophytocola sp.]